MSIVCVNKSIIFEKLRATEKGSEALSLLIPQYISDNTDDVTNQELEELQVICALARLSSTSIVLEVGNRNTSIAATLSINLPSSQIYTTDASPADISLIGREPMFHNRIKFINEVALASEGAYLYKDLEVDMIVFRYFGDNNSLETTYENLVGRLNKVNKDAIVIWHGYGRKDCGGLTQYVDRVSNTNDMYLAEGCHISFFYPNKNNSTPPFQTLSI